MKATLRSLGALTLFAFGVLFLSTSTAHAAPLASGSFAADDSFFSYSFTTSMSNNYTFATTSFAGGGFVPALTLFRQSGGTPISFADTGTSDVSISQLLGPGSYILYLTEDPNVFTGKLSEGTLFAGSPNATGDICGVTGGKFLDTFNTVCTQRTANFAITQTITAATPEPASWVLVLSPLSALCLRRYRRRNS